MGRKGGRIEGKGNKVVLPVFTSSDVHVAYSVNILDGMSSFGQK